MKTVLLTLCAFFAVTAQPVTTAFSANSQTVRPAVAPDAIYWREFAPAATPAVWDAGSVPAKPAGVESVLLAKLQPLAAGEAGEAALPVLLAGTEANPEALAAGVIGPVNGPAAGVRVIEPTTAITPAASSFAERVAPVRERPERGVFRSNKIWTASVVAHLATTLSDGITSYYLIDVWHLGTENNRIINMFNGGNDATFGVGGFLYKAIWFAAINVPAYYVLKKHGRKNRALQTLFAGMNFESTAMFTYETFRNAHYMSTLPH